MTYGGPPSCKVLELPLRRTDFIGRGLSFFLDQVTVPAQNIHMRKRETERERGRGREREREREREGEGERGRERERSNMATDCTSKPC